MHRYMATGCLSIVGCFLFGGAMLLTTLLLGHMRPMWMEFSDTPLAAMVGLLLGLVVGLAIDRWRFARQPKPKRTRR